jgi:hypothetical protein
MAMPAPLSGDGNTKINSALKLIKIRIGLSDVVHTSAKYST